MTYIPNGSLKPGGGGPGFGASLFKWNRVDLAQFDTANLLNFEDTLGSGPSGSMAASFVAAGFKGEPVIRLTATAILGGSVLTILPSELTLPKKYVMRVHVVGISTASLGALVCPFGNAAGVGWRGIVFFRENGFSSDLTLTTNQAGTQRLRNPTASVPTSDTWNQALEDRGGIVYTFDCLRQDGAAPDDWYSRVRTQGPSNVDSGAMSRQDATGAHDPSPDWDAQNLKLAGIGVESQTSARSGDVDFLDIEVFAAA